MLWGTAGAHRSKQRSYVRLRRNTGPKATRHPAWECWLTGKLKSTESPCNRGDASHMGHGEQTTTGNGRKVNAGSLSAGREGAGERRQEAAAFGHVSPACIRILAAFNEPLLLGGGGGGQLVSRRGRRRRRLAGAHTASRRAGGCRCRLASEPLAAWRPCRRRPLRARARR